MPNTLSVTATLTGTAPESSLEPAPERYLARAFFLQYNVILLGGAALFSLASASPAPLLVAAIGEVAWLGLGARSAAFRRWVDHRSAENRHTELEAELFNALTTLDPTYHHRFTSIGEEVLEITGVLLQLGMSGAAFDAARQKLLDLRFTFVRLAAVHQRLARFAAESPAAEIDQEIARTRQQLAGEKDLSVRVSVRQSLALAERRLAQWEHIGNTRRAVEVQLDTLEKSFAYLRSRAMTSSRAADVQHEIDTLLSQASSVTLLEAETQDALRY